MVTAMGRSMVMAMESIMAMDTAMGMRKMKKEKKSNEMYTNVLV